VTPDGRYAAFVSAIQITDYQSSNHLEVYRYDAEEGEIDCPSCVPTNAAATGDAALAARGLSITDDGRVFFTSSEPLVLPDTDKTKDAYEWADGEAQLISAGTSQFDSGLLSVTADGKDAFFFTRDVLTPDDNNGGLMKIYDARENGGFFAVPPPPPCAASDECHGPGSEPPPPANIPSVSGTPGNLPGAGRRSCGKGKVKKRGRCVKRHPKRQDRRRNG
jgi:hypothetical protein